MWPGENSIHKNNDAEGKLQKVSGRCLILSSDHYIFSLITSTKVNFVNNVIIKFSTSLYQYNKLLKDERLSANPSTIY
jgi:hypothetical protein